MVANVGDPLFANHVAFMAMHRGTVRSGDDWIRIDGQAPFLTSWTPLAEAVTLPSDDPPVRLVPGSGAGWSDRLVRRGYAPGESLSYMELDCALEARPVPPGYDVRPAQSDDDAIAFAQVQAAAFLNSDSDDRDWWSDCFERMALANYRRAGQDFLIAWRDGRADAVLLALDAANVTGLYAVATRPEAQRRGLSTSLLFAAYLRVRARGASRIILQASRGSYAEGFYRRLGLVERYRSQVWRATGEDPQGPRR